jgi:hypothetical protein
MLMQGGALPMQWDRFHPQGHLQLAMENPRWRAPAKAVLICPLLGQGLLSDRLASANPCMFI